MAIFNLNALFTGPKKNFILISLVILGIGLLADFITNVVWFSRIDPWYRYGSSSMKATYNSTCVCWFFSMIGLIAVAILLMSFFFIKNLFSKISEGTSTSILTIVVITVLSLISLISAFVSASYGLKEFYSKEYFSRINDDDDDYGNYNIEVPMNYKCYSYNEEEDYEQIAAYAFYKNKMNSYYKWQEKIGKKIYKEYIYTDEDGDRAYATKYTNYLCSEVGIPSLVFGIVQIIGLCLFYFIIITSLISSDSDKSINEDDNQANSPIDVEEQPKKIEKHNEEQSKENENDSNEKVDENEDSD